MVAVIFAMLAHPAQEGTEKKGRMPFGRIYEWLDIAEQLVFEDPQVHS